MGVLFRHDDLRKLIIGLQKFLPADQASCLDDQIRDVQILAAGDHGDVGEFSIFEVPEAAGPFGQFRLGQRDAGPDSLDHPGHRHAAQHLCHTLVHQRAGHDRGRGRAVAHFMLLGLGNIDHHLGGRMIDIHFIQNGDAVVGDDHLTEPVHQHSIQSFGADRSLHRRRDRPDRRRIRHQGRQALVDFTAAGLFYIHVPASASTEDIFSESAPYVSA